MNGLIGDNKGVSRFAIEHLPRSSAIYRATPINFEEARTWLAAGNLTSLVRTSEVIQAIRAAFGVELTPADSLMVLAPGDEALLISLSYAVTLAWAEGGILPLEEDWRCLLIRVEPSGYDERRSLAALVPQRERVSEN